MSPPIPSSPRSSSASAKPLRLEPERSRLLRAWWVGVHALALLGVAASGLPAAAKLAAVLALIVHLRRAPADPPVVLRRADGTWSLPQRGPEALRLGPGTCVGGFWVLLRLTGAGGRVQVLLLEDQLPPQAWRALRAELGRPPIGTV